MDATQIIKSSQEQGVAAWIAYLNQLRIEKLMHALMAQDVHLKEALHELAQAKIDVFGLIESNRGGTKGMHGFIAERAQVGIENARNLVTGQQAQTVWINDNGPTDFLRGDLEIQQKFVERHLGLDAIKTHLKTYPQFSQEGHKYQIPKDFYDKLQSYLSMSEETANRLPREDRTLWKYIQTFFSETGLEPNDIEPAAFDYNDAQRDRIDRTLDKEQTQIKKTDQEKRNAAIQQSNPTLKEGIQATAVSAGIEGGITLLLTISKKLKQGRHLSEFTEEDWKDVGLNTAGGTVKGAVRGATVYGLTNFSATPAPVASALVSAIFGVVGQAYQLQQGALSADEFVANSEVICMDVAVGAVSSLIGQVAIPIPVLGAIVGNAVGMFLNGIAKDHLGKQEQALILSYTEKIEQLNRKLDAKYRQLLEELKQEFAKFTSILDLAFDLNVNIAFNGSIQLADYSGVPQEKVLRNRSDIDNFFLS